MVWLTILLGLIAMLSWILLSMMWTGASYLSNQKANLEKELEGAREAVEWAHERHDEIEAELRAQVTSLAQQLATIRVENPGATSDQERFEQMPKPPEPYSQQLYDFLIRIEYEEARNLVEEEIERYRSQGMDDEQIYNIVSGANV
jgi:cell division protein FtsB